MRTVLALVGMLFLTSAWVGGQDKKRQLQVKPPPVYRQLEQPIHPHYLKLFKPDFAKLNLAVISTGTDESNKTRVERFSLGSPISVELKITNSSEKEVGIFSLLDLRVLNRPQLYRNGELVPYGDKVRSLLATDPAPNGRTNVYVLEPSKSITETIKLDDWYEPLQPGRYELSIWHRFLWGGDWLESPAVAFEVAAEGMNKIKVMHPSARGSASGLRSRW